MHSRRRIRTWIMIRCSLFNFLSALLIILVFSHGRAIGDEVDLIPVEAFASAQGYQSATLSPDGQHVALLDIVGENPAILIFQVSGKKAEEIGRFQFAQSQIDQMVWVSQNNLLVSQTITPLELEENSNLQRQLVNIDIAESRASAVWSVEINRLIANEPLSMLRVLDWSSGDILISMPTDTEFYPAVHVLNIYSGELSILEVPTPGITKWLADWDGQVRLATGIDEEDKSVVWYRKSVDSEWTDLSGNRIFSDGYFQPIAFDKSGNNLYMKSALGKARKGLYEFDLSNERIRRKIYEHPKYDIGSVVLSNFDREVAGISYIDDYFQIDYLSDSMQKVVTSVNEHLSESRNIILDWSFENDIFLIFSERAPFPARYFVYQATENALIELPATGEQLHRYPLILPERVTYFSRDGLEIPAYLTRPQTSTKQPPAAVVLPHGGPWARDFITYNDWAQFFANRGYVVLQPNYRGSSGYGTLFENRGHGEWGEGMQRDLDDAVHWLIEQEIADPERICIAGGSYGGYAALMASIESTDLFKCAIAFAPVTDIEKYADSFSQSPYRKSMQSMILGENSAEVIRSNSPVQRSNDVGIPLLIIHGTSDIRVPIYHSRDMVEALNQSKVDVTYLELEGESHFLSQPSNRIEVFRAMEKHLQQNLIME